MTSGTLPAGLTLSQSTGAITALKNNPRTVVVIVSDHGFVRVDHALNLAVPFVQGRLIQLGKGAAGTVTVASWKAAPWSAGGLAAIQLSDPADAGTREQVRTILSQLASDPANGIAKILDPTEIRQCNPLPSYHCFDFVD